MATQLHNVRRNYIWRIEALAPTLRPDQRFRHFDPRTFKGSNQSGIARHFFVVRDGSSADDRDGTGLRFRKANHAYQVKILYPQSLGFDLQQDMIAQDRFTVTTGLFNPNTFLGYSDSATSTNVGIRTRWVEGDEVVESDDIENVDELIINFESFIEETV